MPEFVIDVKNVDCKELESWLIQELDEDFQILEVYYSGACFGLFGTSLKVGFQPKEEALKNEIEILLKKVFRFQKIRLFHYYW